MTALTYDELINKDSDYPTVIISDKNSFPKLNNNLQIVPQVNVLGIGCRKNVTFKMMQDAFNQFCNNNNLVWKSISKLVSIDVKQHEAAIHYLASVLGVEFETYSAMQLKDVSQHYPTSKFVEKTVGVGNVANSAAEYATGNRTLKKDKESLDEVTMALSRAHQERK
ncbi:cobalamin biosynthesis protein [Lentilactobacillus kosonis]|uniref:Cobalamin biosynthesis protein CbiG n=1 Tax=Lentilactobacillus kosonis TaxID=2810561 RepID=A0A401FN16_9LACO|nr:cobalamin biosynthesis protein [Lentilactobacillus kosonis]GAY73658.1 cobalamin biosynthesis protein CbiG [Lentilactobacillus kosonis]